jgi:hypothetical protein
MTPRVIMREVKRHPEWHDIQDVPITRPERLPTSPTKLGRRLHDDRTTSHA